MDIDFEEWGVDPNQIKNLFDEDSEFAVPLENSSRILHTTPEIISEEEYIEEEYEEEDHRECIICLCDFTPEDPEKKISCGHRFHKTCIDEWAKQNNTCPLCRKEIEENQEDEWEERLVLAAHLFNATQPINRLNNLPEFQEMEDRAQLFILRDEFLREIADTGGVISNGIFYPQNRLPYAYHVAQYGTQILLGQIDYLDASRILEGMWINVNMLNGELNMHELMAIETLFPALDGHYWRIENDPQRLMGFDIPPLWVWRQRRNWDELAQEPDFDFEEENQ